MRNDRLSLEKKWCHIAGIMEFDRCVRKGCSVGSKTWSGSLCLMLCAHSGMSASLQE